MPPRTRSTSFSPTEIASLQAQASLWPTGALATSHPDRTGPAFSAGLTGLLTSGTLMLFALPVRAGLTMSAVTFHSGTQAAVAPTNQWAVICNSSRVVKAVSPDLLTEAWATVSPKTFTFAASYTPTTNTFVYVGLMVAAGTVPAIYGTNDAASSQHIAGLAPIMAGASTTGMTTPPTVDSAAQTALTAKVQKAYFYIT